MAEMRYEKNIPLITDSQIMEALKLQLFNISSVGLGNGDFQLNPVNLPCVQAEMQVWSKVMKVVPGAASEIFRETPESG
jgi:hypothetical protein